MKNSSPFQINESELQLNDFRPDATSQIIILGTLVISR